MNMDTLNIEYDALREIANSIGSKADDFGSLLSEIQTANSELMEEWQGTNASKYAEKVAEQAVDMKKLQETIAAISADLLTINDWFADAESNTTLR